LGFLPAPAASASGTLQSALSASDGTSGDAFGDAVAIGWDRLVVGAPGADGCGAAYVFRRDGAVWTEEAKLSPPDPAGGDCFGHSVAIDGDAIVVGAWGDDQAGGAYVFGWDGLAWCQQARLVASDAEAGDSFGCCVSISGGLVAVGAYADQDAGPSSGSVYLFACGEGAWRQEAKLTASDPAKGAYFGCSVSIDGDWVAVGARGDAERGKNAGAVYLFEQAAGEWTEAGKLTAADAAAGDAFGREVALSGGCLAASAPGDDPGGAVYVFRQGQAGWLQEAKLTVPGAEEDDQFGCHVAADGEDVVVGAWGDAAAGVDLGAAHVFTRRGEAWAQVSKLTSPDGCPGQGLGWCVSVYDGCVLAGAPGQGPCEQGGSAFVFAAGTRTVWRAAPGLLGDWDDADNWTAGVPTREVNAAIANGSAAELHAAAVAGALTIGATGPGRLTLGGGELEVRELRLAEQGVLAADADSTIRLHGSFEIQCTDPACLQLLEATVQFAAPEVIGGPQLLEAAGRDLGLDPAGWEGNFALGGLVIEPGAVLRLADRFDNHLRESPGAVYARELVIEPGGGIDLNGCRLYYLNGGEPKQLFPGDADLDGGVDRDDFLALRRSFGTSATAGWADGDTNGDRDVDFLDYVALKRSFAAQVDFSGAAGGNVPEPATLLLLVGPCLLGLLPRRLKRRRS
jgi:hypothetical protein